MSELISSANDERVNPFQRTLVRLFWDLPLQWANFLDDIWTETEGLAIERLIHSGVLNARCSGRVIHRLTDRFVARRGYIGSGCVTDIQGGLKWSLFQCITEKAVDQSVSKLDRGLYDFLLDRAHFRLSSLGENLREELRIKNSLYVVLKEISTLRSPPAIEQIDPTALDLGHASAAAASADAKASASIGDVVVNVAPQIVVPPQTTIINNHIHVPPPLTSAPSSELPPPCHDRREHPSPGASINERMLETIQLNPDSKEWSARQWQEHLSETGRRISTSTISKTEAWKELMRMRANRRESLRENQYAKNDRGQRAPRTD